MFRNLYNHTSNMFEETVPATSGGSDAHFIRHQISDIHVHDEKFGQ